jgi:putative ABC transport system permease protein
MYAQVNFMRNKQLGFDQEQLVVLPVQRLSIVPKYSTFKDRLLTNRSIISVSSANTIVGKDFQSSNYKKEGEPADALTLRPSLFVRNDFVSTLGVPMLAGHDFSEQRTATGNFAIINRALAIEWGWQNPEEAIGQVLEGTLEGKITVQGVVENFHFAPLKETLGPLILIRADGTKWEDFFTRFILIRIHPGDIPSIVNFLKNEWNAMVHESPFDFFFLSDNLQRNYQAEMRFNVITTIFSCMVIFISMLGLFGLASYTVQKRMKEISIRKVLGASVRSLLALLCIDTVKLVFIAASIAVPISIYMLSNWLNLFAYRIEIEAAYFVVSILVLILISFLTIFQVILTAARVNPATTLRNE